jgi:hypothetical protein
MKFLNFKNSFKSKPKCFVCNETLSIDYSTGALLSKWIDNKTKCCNRDYYLSGDNYTIISMSMVDSIYMYIFTTGAFFVYHREPFDLNPVYQMVDLKEQLSEQRIQYCISKFEKFKALL